MSIRFQNAARLTTATNTLIGAGCSKYCYSFRVRINTPPTLQPLATGPYALLTRGYTLAVRLFKMDDPLQPPKFITTNRTTATTLNATYTVTTNVIYHFAFVYDKDDPSKQAWYINGVKTDMNATDSSPSYAGASAPLILGAGDPNTAYQLDFNMEGLHFLNEYAYTASEVADLYGGADPATIGGAAAWGGYWPLTGTVGSAPADGDVGLANAIDGSWALSPVLGAAAGSALIYADPLSGTASQTGYTQPVVGSSGTTVRVGAYLVGPGDQIPVTAGSATVMPTIRVDGGGPITLERPVYSADHAGVLYCLPAGQTVPKNAAVTFSAPEGWFATSYGIASAAVDVAAANRAGKPIYGDLPAEWRLGFNYSAPASKYWSYRQDVKNYAKRIFINYDPATGPTRRADDTVSQAGSYLFYNPVPGYLDKTGTPVPLGLWVVSYDDAAPATPTTIAITNAGGAGGEVVELSDYRNPGDAAGVGKAYVFDVRKKTTNYTLAADCDASTTTLTLSSTTGLLPAAAGASKQWLKFDDEYMDVLAVDAGAGTVTVARHFYGSAAAAHTAGTVGVMSYNNPFPSLMATFAGGPGGSPCYTNLVIYGPGDWTPPDPPAAVVIDRSTAVANGPSQFIQDSMINGLGVVRHMDTTLGFVPAAEPEDMRRDSDLYWGSSSQSRKAFAFVEGRALDTTRSPWFYFSFPVQNGTTFSATLGAAITTAPAAGTAETITVSDAATAPVFYGLRLLLPSGETLRVVDVVGDQVTVVRGANRTTPATQAAGPIMVGYRVAHANRAQTQFLSDVVFELVTDVPHRVAAGFRSTLPAAGDVNPLARVAIALTAAVTDSQTVFPVSAADWTYIVPGLHVVFDSENVLVTASDSGAGTITVTRTAGASHALGVVGAGMSAGLYCEADASGAKAWLNHAGWKFDAQVTGPNTLVLNNNSAQSWLGGSGRPVGIQTLDATPVVVGDVDRKQVTELLPGAALSYEYTARAARLCPGADFWVNLPIGATDDLIDAVAVAIRDELPAGEHRVFVELANEVWNPAWAGFMSAIAKFSAICGYADKHDWWLTRGREAADRIKSWFASVGRGDEVKMVVAYQGGGLGTPLARARAIGVPCEIVATGGYFFPDASATNIAAFDSMTDDQCAELWLFDLEYLLKNIPMSLRADGASRRFHETAPGGGPVDFIHYESGVDSFVPRPSASIANGVQRNVDIGYCPTMRYIAYDYIHAIHKLDGSDGAAIFNLCQIALAIGNGASLYYAPWGNTEYQGQPAGAGDGSDGKADNRLCQATPGRPGTKHPTVNQAENSVSPRLLGHQEYNAAYKALHEPPTPTPDPVPVVGRRTVIHRITIS